MNIKSLKAVLISIFIAALSLSAFSEEMPESPKQKELRIERDLNELFKRGLDAASFKLDRNEDVRPFGIIKKMDGSLGVFELDKTPKNESLSVNSMALSVRRYMTEMAVANQIKASVLVMFAMVKEHDGQLRQGLSFEIEHTEGVSLLRFLPITDNRDDKTADNNKLVLHIESISDTVKPATVFSEMVKALQASTKKN